MTIDHTRAFPAMGLAVLIGVVVGLFIAPAWRSSRALGQEVRDLRTELSKPNSGPEVIRRLDDELASLRALADHRMTPIPDESDVAGLIRDLSTMLAQLGLDRHEITTGESRQLEEASALPMTVMLEGPFPAVSIAIERLESLPRLVRVQRLRVFSDQPRFGAVNRSGFVRADVLLDVFYAPRDVLHDAPEDE